MARRVFLVASMVVFVGCAHTSHPKYPLGDRDYNADPSRTYHKVDLASLVANPSTGSCVEFWAIFNRRDENIWSPLYTPFTSEDYVSFSVWSPDARLWEVEGRQSSVPTLYMAKVHPNLEMLMKLDRYTLVRVVGVVTSSNFNRPWITVERLVPDRRGMVYDEESLRRLMSGLEDAAKAPASAIRNLDLALNGRLHTSARALAHVVLGDLYEKRAAASRDFWKQALNHYDAAVMLDPSSRAAREGYDRASMQVDLLKMEKAVKEKTPEKQPEQPK